MTALTLMMVRCIRLRVCVAWMMGLQAFGSTAAEACSPGPMCLSAHLLPRAGQSIPASTPGFPFRPVRGDDLESDPLGGVQLLDGTGTAVAMHVVFWPSELPRTTAHVLVPDSPLLPGNYTFRRKPDECTGDAGMVEENFMVTSAAPLPTEAGTLAIAATSIQEVRTDHCSDHESSVVDIRWTLGADLVPYGPVVDPIIEVNGYPWTVPVDRPSEPFTPTTRVYRLYARCTNSLGRLGTGRHHVVLRAILPGADKELKPAELDVFISCPDRTGMTDSPPVADTADAPPRAGESSDRGCSLAPNPHTASFAGGAIIVLALALRAAHSRARGFG